MNWAETTGIKAFVADSTYSGTSETILFAHTDGYVYKMESGNSLLTVATSSPVFLLRTFPSVTLVSARPSTRPQSTPIRKVPVSTFFELKRISLEHRKALSNTGSRRTGYRQLGRDYRRSMFSCGRRRTDKLARLFSSDTHGCTRWSWNSSSLPTLTSVTHRLRRPYKYHSSDPQL